MNARHFSQHRAEHHTGPDDPLHQEPLDLSAVPPADYPNHEGEPVMLTDDLLPLVSGEDLRANFQNLSLGDICTFVEARLDGHYGLADTGWGTAFDIRDRTARLVKL